MIVVGDLLLIATILANHMAGYEDIMINEGPARSVANDVNP